MRKQKLIKLLSRGESFVEGMRYKMRILFIYLILFSSRTLDSVVCQSASSTFCLIPLFYYSFLLRTGGWVLEEREIKEQGTLASSVTDF